MILADKIIDERKKNGWSQEEFAEKLGVSRQAVSKWESAGSTPDLQRVIHMAELFGVSTDYLLREDMVPEDASLYVSEGMETRELIRRVSMEEANNFLEMKRKGAPRIANAVSMCIVSPVLLVILTGMAEDRVFNITESIAETVGITFLFLMIAVAVFIFITYGIRESKMEHLEKEIFETEYGVTGMVKERKHSFEPVFTRGIAIGVVLCIISVVPIVVAGGMGVDKIDYIAALFAALLLIMISIGVNMMIRVGIIKGSYDILLQEGDYTESKKIMNKKLSLLPGVYWALTAAVYIGLSFLTMRWDITWIVWPVAGLLFVAVWGVAKLVVGRKDNNAW
ncbi:MAG: helix-turn-helix domain-containing protein [Lentihominibacter sp.]